MVNKRAVMLTDDLIKVYAGDNIIKEYVDINLKYVNQLKSYDKSVLDADIFGSMFSKQCNCGEVRTVGVRCDSCHSAVLSKEDAYKRFGRIVLPIYYCSTLKFPFFLTYFKSLFASVALDFKSLKQKKLERKLFDIYQFNYNKDQDVVVITDEITDHTRCSYEGILKIIQEHKPKKLPQFFELVNKNIIVTPIIMRAPRLRVEGDKRDLKMHRITTVYQNLIYSVEDFYKKVEKISSDHFELAMIRACLRQFISQSVDELSELLKTSKENQARTMQSTRVHNSGRCTIVPGPDLKIDEVRLPRHLVYEACREEFISYLTEVLEITTSKAILLYKRDPNTAEIKRLFEEFVLGTDVRPGKWVIINRAPTLHEYNCLACKVRLTDDYTMSLPLTLCKSMGADFDGDTLAWYMIPEEVQEEVSRKMSPRNMVFYKKSLEPLFSPNHEIMNGLTIATKVQYPKVERTYQSFSDALRDEQESILSPWEVVIIEGGRTTVSRWILGKIFDINLEEFLGGLDNYLDSKGVNKLMKNVGKLGDRVERLFEAQKFSLRTVSKFGSTTPKITELVPSETTMVKDYEDVMSDESLSTLEKEIKIRLLYESYLENEQGSIDSELSSRIKESSRAKVSQLISMKSLQLNFTPQGEFSLSKTTLVEGMSPKDYENHAIENRAVQDIKVLSVPISGNLTRHYVYLGCHHKLHKGEDKDNSGILIKEKDALGRTRLDGIIVKESSSDELIKVRSILTSTVGENNITLDMISREIEYVEDGNLGISLTSSSNEGVTQSSLSLKHGGNLFNLDPNAALYAPEDCVLTCSKNTLELTTEGSKLILPKSRTFVINRVRDNSYEKGDLIGYSYNPTTPSSNLDGIIRLTKSRAMIQEKRFARNEVISSQCYALSDGIISYDFSKGEVTIGTHTYELNPNCTYYFPSGTIVKKYDRICSGVADLDFILSNSSTMEEGYYFFRNQFNELISGISHPLIEFIYSLIVKETDRGITLRGVLDSIYDDSSLYMGLSFEAPRKTFKKILPEKGLVIVNDTFTESQLSLLLPD
jgi:DNA-directed RNA polymerase, beta'' subunit/160 kD subunit